MNRCRQIGYDWHNEEKNIQDSFQPHRRPANKLRYLVKGKQTDRQVWLVDKNKNQTTEKVQTHYLLIYLLFHLSTFLPLSLTISPPLLSSHLRTELSARSHAFFGRERESWAIYRDRKSFQNSVGRSAHSALLCETIIMISIRHLHLHHPHQPLR